MVKRVHARPVVPFDQLPLLSEKASGPVDAQGVPHLRQADPRWSKYGLGDKTLRIGAGGCALTAMAMALSGLSHRNIDPDILDRYLDANQGYNGNGLRWSLASGYAGYTVTASYGFDSLDQELLSGHPVIAGVDYKTGSRGGAHGTDHWVLLTGEDADRRGAFYFGVDPASGRSVRFRLKTDGSIGVEGKALHRYTLTGEIRTFSLVA